MDNFHTTPKLCNHHFQQVYEEQERLEPCFLTGKILPKMLLNPRVLMSFKFAFAKV